MKSSQKNRIIIRNKEVIGKVISISEEKNLMKIKLLLNECDVELKVNDGDYKLGDKIEMNMNLEVNGTNKIGD